MMKKSISWRKSHQNLQTVTISKLPTSLSSFTVWRVDLSWLRHFTNQCAKHHRVQQERPAIDVGDRCSWRTPSWSHQDSVVTNIALPDLSLWSMNHRLWRSSSQQKLKLGFSTRNTPVSLINCNLSPSSLFTIFYDFVLPYLLPLFLLSIFIPIFSLNLFCLKTYSLFFRFPNRKIITWW